MKKRSFTDDVTILDRYQSFSAEILRLSLLGVGVIGFLVTTAVQKTEPCIQRVVSLSSPGVRYLLIVSLGAFGFAAAFALIHRYYSTESMACHLALERLSSGDSGREEEKKARDIAFQISGFAIAAAPISLVVGATSIAVAFILALSA